MQTGNSQRATRIWFAAAFLALVVPLEAYGQNVSAPRWQADAAGTGHANCQTAWNAALDFYRAVYNDPLVVKGPTCETALQAQGSNTNFYVNFIRTYDFPTTPDRSAFINARCVNAGLGEDASRGIYCGSSVAWRNIGLCCEPGRTGNPARGNPVCPAYGNKLQIEVDYVGFGPFPLRFERIHNSARGHGLANLSGLAGNWTHNYERRLAFSGPSGGSIYSATVTRPDGRGLAFNVAGGNFVGDVEVSEQLRKVAGGWELKTPDDETEFYDEEGKLLTISNRAGLIQNLEYFPDGLNKGLLKSVIDPFARKLEFTYTDRRLATMTIPGGGTFLYAHNPNFPSQPTTVTNPMKGVRTYYHELGNEGGFSQMLTGIRDELNFRYVGWQYDSSGRPSLSAFTGSAGRTEFTYDAANGTANVTSFVSATQTATNTYSFQNMQGLILNTGISGPACPQCGPAAVIYNARGFATQLTDWNGNQTSIVYDEPRNLEIERAEGRRNGADTLVTIRTRKQWHPVFRLPTAVQEPLRITTYSYDPDGTQCGARGALCSKSVQATTDNNGSQGFSAAPTGNPRVWTYSYNTNGQVLTENGPRTDVADTTTYTYYDNGDGDIGKRGNLATIVNAVGHTTYITAYTAHGQPLTIVDPNGLTTTFAYDGRQRLISRNVGGETTSYNYDAAGQLTKITLPDASSLSYGYDAAHRLTSIEDNLKNRIAYPLDLAGNRIQEQVFDPKGMLVQTRGRVYSNLNRLFQELGAAGQTTEYTYDPQGNVLSVKDPLNQTTFNGYDELNRLRQVTDPASGATVFGYDGLSALASVTDPRKNATSYTVDGLRNLTLQVSPDSGSTTNAYDLAGNLATQTDAKSQTTTYTHDALNRVALIVFHDGSREAFAYDAGANGIGRLTSITETNAASQVTSLIAYGYDQKGRVTSETRNVNGVASTLAYSYDASGRLQGLTYPFGRTVVYTLDALGRVTGVNTAKGGQAKILAQNVEYHPFGGAKSWTFGNGQPYTRSVDQDGRIASYTLGGTTSTIAFDAASRITGIAANTYGYDSLDRLTSATLPSSSFGYSYDALGNRLTKVAGAVTDIYSYSTTSNRIATLTPASGPQRSFVLDANGSTTADGLNTYVYDTRGRMVQSTNAASLVTTYQVNALGQRVRKTNAGTDTVFHYDAWGKLIAETTPAGQVRREYLYLGDIPLAVIRAGAP